MNHRMKDDDQVPADEGIPWGLTIVRPEEETFQRLHLCKYLNELPEIAGDETDDSKVDKQAPKI